ncbi:DUF905 domain-containing protein [Klebsiella pneumoniae]|nr:DUF905 domain-containing protein [Klebsiella pneumoniae]
MAIEDDQGDPFSPCRPSSRDDGSMIWRVWNFEPART